MTKADRSQSDGLMTKKITEGRKEVGEWHQLPVGNDGIDRLLDAIIGYGY